MTIRSFAAAASVLALCLIGAASPGISGETARDQTAPFAVAAVQGTAPNFAGISHWFNSAPLNIADLRGKVVLVEFWAFDCINCRRSVPAMKKLDEAYDGKDVVIVGVHTPELPQERDPYNVEKAVAKLGLKYPIALDNDYRVWKAFKNRYWPALYVVDKHGIIRHTHVGELHEDSPGWEEVVRWIDELRKEPA